MGLVPLIGGAYEAKSVIADSQRCINQYVENNPKDAPSPTTHYGTPGLVKETTGFLGVRVGPSRGLWTAKNNELFWVCGSEVYYVDLYSNIHALGAIPWANTPCGMADNGIDLVITDGHHVHPTQTTLTSTSAGGSSTVDVANVTGAALGDPITVTLDDATFHKTLISGVTGSTIGLVIPLPSQASAGNAAVFTIVSERGGWKVNLATHAFAVYDDSDFLGSTRVDFLDTYFLFNEPETSNFYSSLSNTTQIDPLYLAALSGQPTLLQGVATVREEIWLLGDRFGEVWGDVGATTFPFQRIPGAGLMHGCTAPYSIAVSDLSVFFVGHDRQGSGIIFEGTNYECKRISTHGIEQTIQKYPTLSDAIGFVYQIEGHTFYVVHFPSGDATWVFDKATAQWHQWSTRDEQGNLRRHRSNCFALAYGKLWVGDYENEKLYSLNSEVGTDDGVPITRVRSWPPVITGIDPATGQAMPPDGRLITVNNFKAYIETGEAHLENDLDNPPVCWLKWSYDNGKTWGNPVMQSMGTEGQYLTQPLWTRLGQGRYIVFELGLSMNTKYALNGAFVDLSVAKK